MKRCCWTVLAMLLAKAVPALTLDCGSLLDVKSGKWLQRVSIVVDHDIIVSIGAQQAGQSQDHVDLTKLSCLPGLIDSHTHLTLERGPTSYSDAFRLNVADYAIRSTVNARITLEAGFSTVRDLGDTDYVTVALRNAINAGRVPGPRIFTAGLAIGSTGGHADPTDGYREDLAGDPGPLKGVIDSPDGARKAVREHYKRSVDLIKIMPSGGVMDESRALDNPQLTEEELAALVATAHDYGMAVAAHAHGAEAIRRAVLAGVTSIEHGTFMDAQDMQLMKQHGTWLVPTLTAGQFVSDKAREPGYLPPQVAAKALGIGPKMQEMLGRAYKAGVRIAFGTDAGVYPHGGNAQEFTLMVAAGMPAIEAIRAATLNAAALLAQSDRLGQIAPGYAADIIAVEGDPLQDVSVLRHVSFVMKAGTIYKRP